MSEKQLVPSNVQRSRASNTYHVERKSPTVDVQDVIENDSSGDNLVLLMIWKHPPIVDLSVRVSPIFTP